MNKITKSINILNYILFIFLILMNLSFYYFDTSRLFYEYNIFINIVIFSLYIYFNKKYTTEYIDIGNNIKVLNGAVLKGNTPEIQNLLLKKNTYSENESTYKIFKNMYIKKNLLAKDYEDLKGVFLKFIPETFLNEIGTMGNDKITLGLSVKKHFNVMFLDIIGFTSLTEKLTPDKSLLLLNMYFDGIVGIIRENGGYIDKFLGDGIMIVFDDKYSDSIIKASIEIQLFITKFQISEVGRKIAIGIGINSGEVILGTIGSRKRMEITIIGDVVNTASRIEGLTRQFKDNILISYNTYKLIKNKKDFLIKDIGLKILRGKKKKIHIYSVDSIINVNL